MSSPVGSGVGTRGGWGALLVVTFVGGAIRWLVTQSASPVLLVGDEHYYLEVARSLATGAGHHSARLDAFAAWPPGQAVWLSWFLPEAESIFAPKTHAPPPLLVAQVALGTVLVALVGVLGNLLAGPRVGLVAALGAALFPTLVAFSHYLWATTLFTTLVVAAWCGVVLAAQRKSTAFSVCAGLFFGLAALTRETGAVLAGGSAIWLYWRAAPAERRRAAAQGALMLVVCGLVVLPWTLRNLERTGRAIPVASVGWMALREGNTIDPDDWMREDGLALAEFRRRYAALSEGERSDLARQEAIELIAAAQPTWLFVKLVRNLAWLSSPDSFLLRKLRFDAYGALPRSRVRGILVLTVASYTALLVLGSLGLTIAIGRGAGSFALTAAAPLLLLHVVANASPRYRVPLLPLLLIGSGIAATGWRELHTGLSQPRALPVLLLLLFFFAVSLPAFLPIATELWNRGTLIGP